MKSSETRAVRARRPKVNTLLPPSPRHSLSGPAFHPPTRPICKKRPRGVIKRTKRPSGSPKLTHRQQTSSSTTHLQIQTLPILQSQQSHAPIQFCKTLENTLSHSGHHHSPPVADSSSPRVENEADDVGGYLSSISDHLFRQQSRFPPPPFLYSGNFDHQARISNLHLMFGLANRYGFKVETIFLAFSLYHRVAFATEFSHLPFSLQAVASLFVAAKYEEIAIPRAEMFARCDPKIDPQAILEVESQILLHLNFNLSLPSALQFIDLLYVRYSLDRSTRDKLISICYRSLNSLALWQERGSLLAMACLHVLRPDLQLGQSRSVQLQAELKWRVAELVRVGVNVTSTLI